QAGESYLKDQEGTGIGLALTKELVELHYGQISVESSQGKGTTFTLILPLGNEHLKPEEMVTESAYDAVIPATSDNGLNLSLPFVPPEVDYRPHADENNLTDHLENLEEITQPLVLIVEDNDDLRAYIRSYLDHDYIVSEAFDGEQGLQKAIEKIPDLIISDVMMPKMDGIQMCSKLKTDECTSHIPVILLTAKAAIEDRIEGLETGADDFITKPFDPHELLVRIKNLILQRAKLRDYYLKQLTAGKEQEAPVLSLDQQFLEKAHRIVKENMTEFNFSVEAFAGEMAMSRVQLHRKIKALLNQTDTEFIRNLRLMRAASLIKAGKGNITEIAFEVGFNNLSWFARCFQEYFGENPSAFASRHGKP
ncbi:MAG: response regulator, partial [Anaerolineales bacterium]|nr:response regulator [Anaerolineales bacterium]